MAIAAPGLARRLAGLGTSNASESTGVFVAFDRFDTIALHPSGARPVIWFRLHNKTKWALSVCIYPIRTWDGPYELKQFSLPNGRRISAQADGGIEDLIYNLAESAEGNRFPEYQHLFDIGTAWLPPGHSAQFFVDRGKFVNGTTLKLDFNYEWEWRWHHKQPIALEPGGVKHTVRYRYRQLPPSTRRD